MGNETKERYENITRSDNFKTVFDNYFFYFNAFDPNDRNNPKDLRILPNHHHKLQNGVLNYYKSSTSNTINQDSQRDENIENDEKILYNNQNYNKELISNQNQGQNFPSNYVLKHSSSQIIPNSNNLGNYQSGVMFKKIDGVGGGTISGGSTNYSNNDVKIMTNIDSKFSKIKNMSNSGSASSLLRQYKVSGISSFSGGTSGSGNQVNNFSSIMNQNNKSLIGSSISSNNSTSTSNQNNNNISSSNNVNLQNKNTGSGSNTYMRKSGSATYLGKN